MKEERKKASQNRDSQVKWNRTFLRYETIKSESEVKIWDVNGQIS